MSYKTVFTISPEFNADIVNIIIVGTVVLSYLQKKL